MSEGGDTIEALRYPVGRFEVRDGTDQADRERMIDEIAALPGRLRDAIAGLDDARLDTPYRPGGWTVRQVVHHVPDSHVNAYVRFKLAATEDDPLIRTYDEAAWAELPDGRSQDIETSLVLLESLHRRWTRLLRSLAPDDWRRPLRHPESGAMTLDELLQLYAWHGRHHLAHVTGLREREGW